MKPLAITLIALNSLPLLVYPFVMIANLMSYAATANSGTSGAFAMAAKGFMISSSLYPLALIAFLIPTIREMRRSRHGNAVWWQVGMVSYIGLVIALAATWFMLE